MSLPLASGAVLLSLNPAGGGVEPEFIEVYGATGYTALLAEGSFACACTANVPGAVAHRPLLVSSFIGQSPVPGSRFFEPSALHLSYHYVI